MNETLEAKLHKATASLTRAENARDLIGMASAHKVIRITVRDIYKEAIDIPTVLHTEQIINKAHGNVVGKSHEARKTHEMLAIQAATGQELYAKFRKNPKTYVEWADDTRKNVLRGRPFAENIPFESVRSSLTEFRNQLIEDIAVHRTIDPFADRKETNLVRIDATVQAERDFLADFIDNRRISRDDKEEQKSESRKKFDKRITTQTRRIQPE